MGGKSSREISDEIVNEIFVTAQNVKPIESFSAALAPYFQALKEHLKKADDMEIESAVAELSQRIVGQLATQVLHSLKDDLEFNRRLFVPLVDHMKAANFPAYSLAEALLTLIKKESSCENIQLPVMEMWLKYTFHESSFITNMDSAKFLNFRRLYFDTLFSAMFDFSRKNNREYFLKLVKMLASINVPCLKPDEELNAFTSLGYAVRMESAARIECVRALLESGNFSVDSRNELKETDNATPLMLACACEYEGAADVVVELLTYSPNKELKDKNGNTALHYAARNSKYPQIVAELLASGGFLHEANNDGLTPLMAAFSSSSTHPDTIKFLLGGGASRADLNATMIESAFRSDSFDAVMTLFREGCKITEDSIKGMINGRNEKSPENQHRATEIMLQLLTESEKLNPQNFSDGFRLLIGKVIAMFVHEVQINDKEHADRVATSIRLMRALLASVPNCVKNVAELYADDKEEAQRHLPLLAAVFNTDSASSPELLQLLLENGWDVNEKASDVQGGRSVLSYAVSSNHPRALEMLDTFLTHAGENLDTNAACSSSGNNVLHFAAANKDVPQIVEKIVKSDKISLGDELFAQKNSQKRTPHEEAVHNHQSEEIAELLKK